MVKSTAIVAAALFPTAFAFYAKNSPVLQVDGVSYNSLIAKSNYTSIVEFYAPWCGHCQNLKPAYEKAAKSLTGLAKVAAVNCDEEMNKPFCGQMGVQGFPTLKIVRPSKKAGKPTVEDYQGQRTAKAIVDAVLDKSPNHVKRLKDADYASWLAEDASPKAVLFSDKGIISALLKSVAIEFLGSIDIAQIRDKEKEAVSEFSVSKFPTLILLPGAGKDPVTYDGELKKDAIVKFLSQVATPNPDPAPSAKKTKGTAGSKDKASKSSSKFAKSSASQASKQAQTDAASQTLEEMEEAPTESPNPRVNTDQKPIKIPDLAPPIVSLQDGLSLQQKCLNDKASTCILALLPEEETPTLKTIQAVSSLSEIHHKHAQGKRNLFPFYQCPHSNSQASALRKLLKLSPSGVEIIAINGKRSWWRHYTGSDLNQIAIEDWIDAIRMGDSPKLDVPKNLVVPASDLPPEPVKMEDMPKPKTGAGAKAGANDPDLEAMRENFKGQMPEGMDFEIEEVSDEEYEKIMKQEGGHDEL